ncbi:hypothetical protein Arcve_1189 [Archaeoglobus veneficus SNP6]|uniref:Uncharacterized protein n=2 Tax=Archaeoglobus veneficus TaxID=58290 RepID=F2KMJ9_ARCVS|nr:hypothetical protein Arcve_1189 [Archaeoglobus veneficus SNP6]
MDGEGNFFKQIMVIIIISMKPAELLELLEHKRTAIVTDDDYSATTLLYYTIAPLVKEKLHLVVYSEIMCRKLGIVFDSIVRDEPRLKDVIDNLRVIKIGKKEEVAYGKLVAFVDESKDIHETVRELQRIMNRLEDNSIVVFLGSGLAIHKYGISTVVKATEELFSGIKSSLTELYFIPSPVSMNVIAKLFDVVIRVKRSEDFDIMASARVYDVYVEHSILRELPPTPLYRIQDTELHEII